MRKLLLLFPLFLFSISVSSEEIKGLIGLDNFYSITILKSHVPSKNTVCFNNKSLSMLESVNKSIQLSQDFEDKIFEERKKYTNSKKIEDLDIEAIKHLPPKSIEYYCDKTKDRLDYLIKNMFVKK